MNQDGAEDEALVQPPRTTQSQDAMLEVSKKMQRLFGSTKKRAPSVPGQDGKIAEMAEIIQTYRGVNDEEHEQAVPWFDSPRFDLSICIIIILNIIVMGLEIDLGDYNKNGYDRDPVWIVLEWLFCLIFVAEVCIKVHYHTWRWFFADVWSWLALFIATMAVVDVVILSPLGLSGQLRMLSLVRIINLLRLKKVVSEYKVLKELQLVMSGLMGCLLNLAWAIGLLLIMLYVFAIWTTTSIGHRTDYRTFHQTSHGWDNEELFGSIIRSMLTLLQVMTLDTWSSGVARQVVEEQWYMIFFFVLFLLLTTYGVMNLIVSIIVEQALTASRNVELRSRSREERARAAELEHIETIFLLADTDCGGELDIDEWVKACNDPEILWRLRAIELHRNDAMRLFQVIDGNGSRTLSMQEFIEGCTKLKGVARSKDLLALQSQADVMSKNMDYLGTELQDSETMLAALDVATSRMTDRFVPTLASKRVSIAEQVRGSAPMLPIPHSGPGSVTGPPLKVGNQPLLPEFPNLLG